jgi:N12 class adenine-specific DNA methylase
MDELTGSKGIVFATGTPVSNSMTELFTMLATEESGYHMRIHFAKFYNLPELIYIFNKE